MNDRKNPLPLSFFSGFCPVHHLTRELFCAMTMCVKFSFRSDVMNSKVKERGLFALGVAICFAVAGVSVLIEKLIPGVGHIDHRAVYGYYNKQLFPPLVDGARIKVYV